MKNATKLALLFCCAFLSTIALKAQSWLPAGLDDANQPGYTPSAYNAITSDKAGGIYLAYTDNAFDASLANQRRLSVRQWNGTMWSQVGVRAFSTGDAQNPQMAVGQGSVPYVIYRDMGVGRKVVVKKFNGTTWVDFGGGAVSSGPADFPDISLGTSDTVFVAYSDSTAGKKANVKKWNGTSWLTVGAANFSAGNIISLRMVMTSNNQPMVYVLYYNQTSEVFRYNGNAWASLGDPADATAHADWGDLTLLKGDTALVAYSDGMNNSYSITAKKYNGTAWVTAGSNISPNRATNLHFVRDTVNGPLLSFLSDTTFYYYNPRFTLVRRFNGSAWTVAGPDSFVLKRYSMWPLIAEDSAKVPYLFVEDGAYNNKPMVLKLANNSWQLTGTSSGIAHDGSFGATVVATPDGKKAFCMAPNWGGMGGGPSRILSYDNNGWTMIGQSGLTGDWNGRPMNIIAHPDGHPWIMIDDSTGPGTRSIWRHTNSGWMNTGFYDTANIADLYVDGGGNVYVTHQNWNGSTNMKVQKYTDTGWQMLSNAPTVNNNDADFIRLAVSNTGVMYRLEGVHVSTGPYYFYTFEVSRFDNGTWTQLGSAFTTANPTYYYGDPEITTDSTGVPYIVYQNTAQMTPKLQRYDAANNIWVDVVPAASMPSKASCPTIHFAPDGTLYMCSGDNNINNPNNSPTVRKLVGNTLQTVGSATFAKTKVYYPSLAILNNRLLTTFYDGAAYAYQYDCPTPAIITQQPIDTLKCSGTSTSFKLTATGAASYRWQYNTGFGWKNIPANTTYSGVTTNTVQLNNITLAMSGTQYRCLLTNSCGTTMLSDNATLYVDTTTPPAAGITIAANKQGVCAGAPITFSASTTNAGFLHSFQWFVNNTAVSGSTDSVFTTGTLNDGDTAYCALTRLSACAIAPVTVQSNKIGASIITTQNATITISVSPGTQNPPLTPVTFTATITNGGPAPAYLWTRNGSAISGATNSTYTTTLINDGDVIKARVIRTDTCATVNPVTSAGITMHVNTGVQQINSAYGINVYPQPAQQTLFVDVPAGIAAGNYTLQLFNTTGTKILQTEFQQGSGATTHQISIPASVPAGMYLLMISNSSAVKVAEGMIMIAR